jgi:catechol 2,3-dioxygenase-like lactoylglutathione lyase family enzyme
MSLSNYRVGAAVAVSDMDRAREFYEGRLGLSEGTDVGDGGRTYICAGETELHVFPSPEHAGKPTATVAGWSVDDVEAVVEQLSSKGVTFERYEDLSPDAKGIHSPGGGARAAWFRDPDGNTFGLIEEPS